MLLVLFLVYHGLVFIIVLVFFLVYDCFAFSLIHHDVGFVFGLLWFSFHHGAGFLFSLSQVVLVHCIMYYVYVVPEADPVVMRVIGVR